MRDPFFLDKFIKFYRQNKIETDSFIYPFMLIVYNGLKSISSLGYQGPLWKREPGMLEVEEFFSSRMDFIHKNNIVCEFIRFNPFLENHIPLKGLFNIQESSSFYVIDVKSSPEEYLSSLPNRTRAILSKHLKDTAIISKSVGLLESALKYKNEFFYDINSLTSLVKSDFAVQMTYLVNDFEVASSLFFVSDYSAYYIANSSSEKGKQYGANAIIIYNFYKYAFNKGFKHIGLGGGINENDSLSLFKKQFANSILKTNHLKLIHNEEIYYKANKNKRERFFPPYLENTNLLKLRVSH